jgi:hypothetical protein
MKKHNSLTFKQELISSLILILIFCGFGAICFFITVPYYNDERGWIIPVLIFFAGVCLLAVILNVKLKVKIQNTVNTPLNSLTSGDHEIIGKVKTIGKVIKSPTGQECVYYSAFWINQIYIGTGESGRYEEILIQEEKDYCTFVIEDEYGNVELDLSEFNHNSLRVSDLKKVSLKNLQSKPIGNVESQKYEEIILKNGDEFYFNGSIEEMKFNDNKSPLVLTKTPPLLKRIPTGAKKYKITKTVIIGNKSEEKIIHNRNKIIVIAFVLFVLFATPAIMLHLFTVSEIMQFMNKPLSDILMKT